MSLFRKRQEVVPQPTPEELLAAELEAWRPIGSTFRYLGRECVVTGYTRSVYYMHIVSITYINLSADYADDHGVIHNIAFGFAEAQALMAANP